MGSQSPSRVALVGPTHPAPGGIVHFTEGLAGELRRRGPTLVVGWARRFPEFLYPGTISDATSTTIISAHGMPVLDLLDPRTWRRATREITGFGADLVVLQWWHPMHAPVIRFLQRSLRRRGIPVALICHNVEPHESNGVWRALTRRTLRGADLLVVHADALKSEAAALAPGVPITVAFHPTYDNVAGAAGQPDPQRIVELRRRVGAEDRPLLLTFGYVRPYKGIEDAIAAVGQSSTAPALLVAGECWGDEAIYRAAVDEHGVADRVTLDFRYVPNDELPAMFGAADAVVLPYREATQSGVAALAFAYDRPVVATAVGGLPDLVEDGVTGALAPAADPAALAAAIDRVLAAPLDRWQPGIERTRDRFSWQRYVDLLLGSSASVRRRRDPITHAVLDVTSRTAKAQKLIAVLERQRPLRGANLLDIGTGSGTIAVALARAVGAEGSVTSVDVADVRVERDGYRFTRYDGSHLPTGDATVDVVVSNHVIEHVGDRPAQQAHLAEIARVLRPGGFVYLAVPHRWQLVENHYRLPMLGWLPQPLADRYLRAVRGVDRFDVHSLGRRELLHMMRQAGLDARDVTTDLLDVTLALGQERSARLVRHIPPARRLVKGPLLPTIAAVGRKPEGPAEV